KYSILELKYVNLLGLIRAKNNKWDTFASTNDLKNLDKHIEGENEDDLLKREFMYWSKEHNGPKILTLDSILTSAMEQAEKYANIIAHGSARRSDLGVNDIRVFVEKSSDCCILDSYVIMMI